MAHEGDRLPIVPRGKVLNGAGHALLHCTDRLAAGHGPAVRIRVEIVHLLRKFVLHVAPGAALPHAHADLRQARCGHGRNVMIARDRLGRRARTRQVAAVERVDVLAAEPLRERVDLLQAERGDAPVPAPLDAAVEVALRFRVPDQINFRHCGPPKLDHSGIIQYNNLNPRLISRGNVSAPVRAHYTVFLRRAQVLWRAK